ncbi:hypothetical protein ACFX19_028365 [Malus domestica]
MATELVVLRSDLTSLFVDGAIEAKLIDASFYIMFENKTKGTKSLYFFLQLCKCQNTFSTSMWFCNFINRNDMEMEIPKSDIEYLDQRLKTILEENVDKVGKVFILMKHYIQFTLIVWGIQK